MSAKMVSLAELDELAFNALRDRGIARGWAGKLSPRELLAGECRQLMTDASFRVDLLAYLKSNPVVQESVNTVLAQLAFASKDGFVPPTTPLEELQHRGRVVANWLPTFLTISGPFGRLIRFPPSPLALRLKKSGHQTPLLASAKDAFNNDLFRRVRNGFAHWSFTWRPDGINATISLFHFETGALEAEISLLEAEALHYLSATVIRTVDEEILRILI